MNLLRLSLSAISRQTRRLKQLSTVASVLCALTASVVLASTAAAPLAAAIVQVKSVEGVVKDDAGNLLRGVTIRVKGVNGKGAVTDKDGRFSIAGVEDNAVLVLSLIGYAKKEVPTSGQSVVNVVLPLDVKALDDVVVVGYGSSIKREITGSIAKVKASEIADVPVPSFDVAMQGKAAGVVVTQGSGKLGQGIQVRVRGASSISAGQEPLYVVDGVPLTVSYGDFAGNITRSLNPLSDINPQDIESIDVLKDAASAAIYGSRGANGVVMVTTKKGKAGKTNINLSVQRGFSSPSKFLQFADTKQSLEYFNRAAGATDRIEGIDPADPDSYTSGLNAYWAEQSLNLYDPTKPNDLSRTPNTNWAGAVLRNNAPSTQLDLSVSGGNEKTLFHLSGQYMDQEGTIIGNSLSRISARLNVEHKVSSAFKAGINLSLTRTNNNRLPGDNAFSSPLQAVALPPVTPLNDPSTGLPVGSPPGNINIPVYYNPLVGIGNSYRNFVVLRNLGNVFGELSIVEGLSLRGQFGFDIATQSENQWFGSATRRNSGLALGGTTDLNQVIENFSGSAYLNYAKTFEGFGFDAVLGSEYQQSRTKTVTTSAQDLPSDAFRLAGSAAKPTLVDARQTDFTFLSYFLRSNFKILDRFLLTVNARVDGSSRFGANNRYGFFPAASAGWIISSEDFLKDSEVLSFLKLRVSAGRTGNSEIGNFGSRALVVGTSVYGSPSGLLPGTSPSTLANPNLTWEISDQADVGLDYGFLNNRISGELNFYIKASSGLLLNIDVPGTTGFRRQARNVGRMQNRGIEFTLNTDNVNSEEFSWKTSLNISHNDNRVLNLTGQVLQGGIAALPSRAVEGYPIGVFYTPEYAGVNQNNGNAEWFRDSATANGGSVRVRTSTYTQATSIYAGNPLPIFTGAVTNTFNFLGMIDLSFQFNAVIGNRINFYGVGQYSFAGARFEDNVTVDQLNTWSPTNRTATLPETRYLIENGAQASSRFLLDGSFVRLRTATLGFSVPKQWFADANLPISTLRLYVTGLNLLTFTNYGGWDPEVNSDDFGGNIGQGIDFYTAPQPRTIMFGLSVGF
jgi:TonB-dependent starch-binding outer membrane protein SusC